MTLTAIALLALVATPRADSLPSTDLTVRFPRSVDVTGSFTLPPPDIPQSFFIYLFGSSNTDGFTILPPPDPETHRTCPASGLTVEAGATVRFEIDLERN